MEQKDQLQIMNDKQNHDKSDVSSEATALGEIKRTPLTNEHIRLGAKMVEFVGWYMPIQYKGLKEEHLNVRKNVGLFDVSHMGEIRVQGPRSLETLQWLTTNDVSVLKAGQAQYSLFPNEEGGLVDDLIVYCLEPKKDYLLCVNASNKEKDYQWVLKNNQGAQITDESSYWGQIAVQGPKALELCDRILPTIVSDLPSFHLKQMKFMGFEVIVATTGYTGERGCEIFIEAAGCSPLWRTLLDKGLDLGVQAIGLGARDTLRTEMKYPLYGHEIDHLSNPYEAALDWVMKPKVKDFIGKSLIMSVKEKGLSRLLVGLKMVDKGIPRQGYSIFSIENKLIGHVTSGTHSPSLDEPIAVAYLEMAHRTEGQEVYVEIRGRKAKARVCKTPFVS